MAEISFKAGQESRCDWHKPLPQIISESFTEGKKAGIREVVGFVDEEIFPLLNMASVSVHFKDRWNTKLKEWDK